ncbi:MAG: T9SS type A sorting domain-containing protein, partial [Paludibacteraceae bacterium]|nr:T9SS type A sorting domain-containing protein [Paludibacteraceae bacterium]
KQEGGLTGEYFARVKMNGVDTYTCPQTDVETLYGKRDAEQMPTKVKVYPNPVVTTATVTIENPTSFDHTMRILNSNGWQVDQLTFENRSTEIDMSTLPQGYYVVVVDGIAVTLMKK